MALLTVRPTRLDQDVAGTVAAHTNWPIENAAQALTWGADEHVLIAAAAVGWLLTRGSKENTRRLGTHLLVCSLCTALLPHLLKSRVDQKRPDRLTVEGHLHGVPISGRPNDAFPSGHALHMGALASAAPLLPPRWRNAAWSASAILVGTRVILLAHWLTDVVAGLAFGAALERGLRHLTLPQPVLQRDDK
ncbi:MAG: phosphatase PAP2 family protein [Rhizomicrobium sp.]